MKQELIDMLLEYYGELMQERDSIGAYNWKERDKIIKKMYAIETLLNLSEKSKTTMDLIKEIINLKKIKL